ncbi:MAG: hypothetical protein PHH11_13525 [Methylomonas sp.]|nr:hypothetical protein [Methylomonas sp.]
MDNLQKNPNVPMLPGNVLMAGLIYPLKQVFRESIDFLATLENIQSLDGRMPRASGTGRNLPACTVSGEAPVLFFNISGAELFERYVGAGIAGVRRFLERTRNKLPGSCS